jgi:tRNA/rRNA methyltransferase
MGCIVGFRKELLKCHFSIFKHFPKLNPDQLFQNIRIVLCQTSHPGNIGSTARAMKTMGLHNLYLVQPKLFPDPQATALAAGATDILENAIMTNTLPEALAGCAFAIGMSARKRTLSHEIVTPKEAALEANKIALSQPVAFVFGTEMSGLSGEELDCCQLQTLIPANPEYSSLNLAMAVQIMCYELRMSAMEANIHADSKPVETIELATNDELERFYAHLEETLIHIGYINPRAPKKLFERLRRLYSRTRLEKEEVNLLRGILTLSVNPKKHTKY